MKSEESTLYKLCVQAQQLEQANQGLKQRCKALQHILAHQDMMAVMQEQLCHEDGADCGEGGSTAAVPAACSSGPMPGPEGHLSWDHCLPNPLLQCFQSTPDASAYLAVRHSSAQDIAQTWLLLLSTLSLALHCHDMHPEEGQSRARLCQAVTDCNRLIAAVNLVHEDVWPQLWHLNLLTGVHEIPSKGHWQAAVAAAAPTAAQLQEARDVLAITSSKLSQLEETVGRQLQQMTDTHQEPPPAAWQQHQQQQQQVPARTGHTPPTATRLQQHQQEQQQQQQGPLSWCSMDLMQLEGAVSEPAQSSSGGGSQCHPGFIAAAADAAGAPTASECSPAAQLPDGHSIPAAAVLQAAKAVDVEAAAAAGAAGSSHPPTYSPVGEVGPSTASPQRIISSQEGSASGSKGCGHQHFLHALSSLESQEEALAALCSNMGNWRVLQMMLGSLTFLLRPDQLARLYLHSMPYMPIGCLLYDQFGFSPDLQQHDSGSSC